LDQRRSRTSFSWVYILLTAVSVALLGVGIYFAWKQNHWTYAWMGFVLLALTLTNWPIASSLCAQNAEFRALAEQRLNTMSDTMDQMSVLLNLISEQQLLSERAKSVAFREKERDTLRRAIQEEIARQDWEAALALASEIETGFGYKSEADRFRGEINQRRSDIIRRQINDAIAGIDRHIRGENWTAAVREAERLMAVYPADEQVQRLPQDIENRKQSTKRQLLDSWSDAVARKDIDGSIEILKRLDMYLSPAEAESMQEAARNVFKEKLYSLRTQFALAVKQEQWHEAIRIGDEVTRDYPNTQMAREVREMMDSLKQRASGESAAPELAGA
jgi:hypothetical protein